MSETLLTALSILEIVLLVVILAYFLLVVAAQLRSIASTLSEVTWGARAVERQLRAVRSNVRQINEALEDAADTLPGVVSKVEGLSRQETRS